MSFITAIGTANPTHRFSQDTISAFMQRSMKLHNGEAKKLKAIFRATGIQYRHSVLEDYGKTSDFSFYPEPETESEHPGTEARLNIYRKHACELSVNAVKAMREKFTHVQLAGVTHLITVSCTGMYAPGLDIDLVSRLQLRTTVQRTAINFMGCYAAFNGLKVANAICLADENAKVLVVCTELCSLHFQKLASEDNLLANALFADGAAAVLVEQKSESKLKLKIIDFHADLAVDGEKDMAWTIGDLGFEMRLSSYVPDFIKRGISKLTTELLRKISATRARIHHYAIHPGGKKILQVIEEELGIDKDKNKYAYDVLRNYGNMSSPTVLFVLQALVANLGKENAGESILSFAFGPGLTLESMLLQIDSVHA